MAGVDSTVLAAVQANLGLDDPDLAGEVIFLLEVERWDITGSATDTFRAATGEFATAQTDTPAGTDYYPNLEVPSFGQSIFNGNDWEHTTGFVVSQISLLNIDGALDAEFATATESWRGRKAVVLAGLKSWARSQFKIMPGGNVRILDILPGEDKVTLTTGPLADRPDRPLQTNLYEGRGAAYDYAGTATTAFGDVYNVGSRDFSIQFHFKTSTTGAVEVLLDKRGTLSASAGSPGYVVYLNAVDQLLLRLDDGSTAQLLSIGAATAFNDGVEYQLTLTVSRSDDEVIGYIDGLAKLAATSISGLTGSFSNTVALTHGSLAGGSNKADSIMDEARIWYLVLTANQVTNRRPAVDGSEVGLVGAWNYDEYGGTDIFNLIEGPTLVQAGFNGARDCSMGTTAGDPASASAALTGWMRCASGASGIIAGRRNSATTADVGYTVRISSGDFIFEASDGTTVYSVTIAGTYDDDTPYGWGLVIDRDTDELKAWVLDYPRGTLVAGTPDDITSAGTFGGGAINFKLGRYDGGTVPFTGDISWIFYAPAVLTSDDVNIALSEQAADLSDNYPSLPPTLKSYTDLAGTHFWPLNENTGTTATDQAGAVNGTFSSAPTWLDTDGDLTTGVGSAFVSTLEGGADIKGTPKPVALGRVSRIGPVLVDGFFMIYQYSDPVLGPTESIDEVYSGGLELTLTTDYTADKTNNTITLVAASVQPVTMNVRGLIEGGAASWARFPGEIVSFAWRILAGIGLVDTDAITAYDKLLHPFEAGIYITSQTLDELNQFMLAPDGFAYRGTDDKMTLGSRIDPTTATADKTYEAEDIEKIEPVEIPPPTWQHHIGFDRTWYVHDTFLGAADEDVKRAHTQEYRYVVEPREEILTDHADAIPRIYLTPYHRRQDAALLVQRMFALDGVARRGWRVTLAAQHWSAGMSDIAAIGSYNRYDVAGKQFFVAGPQYGMTQGMATSVLTLWG